MGSIKTTQIDGDVSVGRNVAIGGKAKVAGNLHVGHNLKVEGWLDAANIKGINKGVFLTVQELREAYPHPNDGWLACVGASTPFEAYVGKGGDWVATGGTINVSVDISQYTGGMILPENSISTGMIQDGAVTTDKLAADAQEFITQQKTEVVDNLSEGGSDAALSAEQGKNLLDIMRGDGVHADAHLYPFINVGDYQTMHEVEHVLNNIIAGGDAKNNGQVRISLQGVPFCVLNHATSYSDAYWVQALIGPVTLSDGALVYDWRTFNTIWRVKNVDGVSAWKFFNGRTAGTTLYDNSLSHLDASNVQDALDEINTSRVSFERVKLFDGDDTALLHYQNEINLNTEGSAGFSSFNAALAAVKTGLASLQGDKNILHAGFAFRFYNTTTQRMERWQLKVNGWSNNQSDWSRVATVDDIPAGGSGGTAVTIVDNLSEGGSDAALSAEQGKNLNENAVQHDTVSFGGIVEGDIPVQGISFSGEIQEGKIYYSTKLKSFYYRKTESSDITPAQYANNWDGRENYCEEISGEPYKGKVYVAGGSTYVWNGSELVKPVGSGSAVTPVTIVDNLSEGGSDAALSAEQGKTLNENAVQHDTVSFGGIVTDNVQIEMASTVGLGMVVWSDIHGTFLLRVNAKYYNNWNGRERFCAEAGGAPYAEKVYVYNGHTYVYDGMELVRTDMIGDGEVTTDKLAADVVRDSRINELAYDAGESISSTLFNSDVCVNDDAVFTKETILTGIEFEKRLLDSVVQRKDVLFKVLSVDSDKKIIEIKELTLPSSEYGVSFSITIPAGGYFGITKAVAGKNADGNNVPLWGIIRDSDKVKPVKCYVCFSSQLKNGFVFTNTYIKQMAAGFRLEKSSILKEVVSSNKERISVLETHDNGRSVGVSDMTDVLMLGSSLTDDSHSPLGLGWCDRINDLVDINIINGGWSGSTMLVNISNTVKGSVMHSVGDTSKILKGISYIWWGNTANSSPSGIGGISGLLKAKEVTELRGAQMLVGTENPMGSSGVQFDCTYMSFGRENNVPVSAVSALSEKLKIDSPYKGFSSGIHGGYRANAVFIIHADLLSRLNVDKSVKMFRPRPDYKEGNPTIDDLICRNNAERFKKWSAISSGYNVAVGTGKADNRDNETFSVVGTSDHIGFGSSGKEAEIMTFKKGGLISIDKFVMFEFILDYIGIKRGIFTAKCDKQPISVYVQVFNAGVSAEPYVSFVPVDYDYVNGVVIANINRKTEDMQAYDKIRLVIACDGPFSVAEPNFSEYDGILKQKIDTVPFYHQRKSGTELLSKTSVEDGFVLTGTAEVRSLPSEIANYSGFNLVKSHIELKADGDIMKRSVDVSSARKVAVRICANLFPKIATSRTFVSMTDSEREEYISSVPTVVERGYNFGTLILSVKNGASKEFIMQPGWMEYYMEVDVENLSNIEISIGRRLQEDGFTTNSQFKVFVHNVSVQSIL